MHPFKRRFFAIQTYATYNIRFRRVRQRQNSKTNLTGNSRKADVIPLVLFSYFICFFSFYFILSRVHGNYVTLYCEPLFSLLTSRHRSFSVARAGGIIIFFILVMSPFAGEVAQRHRLSTVSQIFNFTGVKGLHSASRRSHVHDEISVAIPCGSNSHKTKT